MVAKLKIDILEMELKRKLPHWLSPVYRYPNEERKKEIREKHRAKARRRAVHEKAKSLLLRTWDESKHPREPAGSPDGGQFTDGGGSLSVAHAMSAETLPVDAALKPISDAGFIARRVEDLPPDVIKELSLTPTESVSEIHAISAASFVKALDDVAGTRLETVKNHRDKIEIVLAGYEPNAASMSTVTGKGRALFLINTKCDRLNVFEHMDIENMSYSAKMGQDLFKKTKDLRAAVALESRIAATHEFAHMADKAYGGELTGTFVDSLILSGIQESKLIDFLRKNISDYATYSPQEAMAEAVSKYIHEGKLPKPLDDWAKVVIKKPIANVPAS